MSEGGAIRLSSTTIAEVAARATWETYGVCSDFEYLLQGVELIRGEAPLPRGEKIPLDARDLTVRVKVAVHAAVPSFSEVARRVQENIFKALQLRLGIVPRRVDVEVENVDWRELEERG